MAKLVLGMNVSLDGYVDHTAFAPDPVLFRHFIDQARGQAGGVYGRKLYEIMSYWEEDQPEWDDAEREFADVWRKQHKWVVSRTLKAVGPNATLVSDDLEATIRGLKDRLEGELDLGGPALARSLTEMGLVDEYRLYVHPIVLDAGPTFFAGSRPALKLLSSERIGAQVMRLAYAPA